MDKKMLLNVVGRLVIANVLLVTVCISILFLSLWLWSSDAGLVIGIILAIVVFAVIVGHYYPIWFKDYISYYWEKQRAKEESRKLVSWDSYGQNGL